MIERFPVRVGDVVFDPKTGEVRRPGVVVRLEPQPAAVLALLAARPGELVGHDELRRAIWGETTHVNFQQSLHYCIRQIRLAMNDRARPVPLIESIPRRGYRLRASGEGQPTAGAVDAGAGLRPLRRGRGTGWPVWLAVAAATVVAVAVIERRPNDHHRMAVAVLQAVHDLVY